MIGHNAPLLSFGAEDQKEGSSYQPTRPMVIAAGNTSGYHDLDLDEDTLAPLTLETANGAQERIMAGVRTTSMKLASYSAEPKQPWREAKNIFAQHPRCQVCSIWKHSLREAPRHQPYMDN